MWNNHHAKFDRNPIKESAVIMLRRIPQPPPPSLDRGMESPRLDRVKHKENSALWEKFCPVEESFGPDQLKTLSQVGTSSYMAYAM